MTLSRSPRPSHCRAMRRQVALVADDPNPSQVHRNAPVKRQNTTAAGQVIIPVVVGGVQVTYMPNIVNAAVGDTIQFQFSSGSHTVTQSTEMGPCSPIAQDSLAQGAVPVHSGHIPFTTGQTTVSTFEMKVTNTEPMFIYCSTGPHCQLGQVMVINP